MTVPAVVVAALAIAGAPAGSQITCDPAIAGQGVAWIDLDRAALGPGPCLAVVLSAMSGRERRETAALNPGLSLGYVQGAGLLVLLHEARHLAGEWNECRAERFARDHLAALIDRFVPAGWRPLAWEGAGDYDRALPASYHSGCADG